MYDLLNDVLVIFIVILIFSIIIILSIWFFGNIRTKQSVKKINITESEYISKDEAIVFNTKIPLIGQYWNIIPYEYSDNKKCLSNYISSGNYVNNDLNDEICIIISNNKILYNNIVHFIKENNKENIIFIPIFVIDEKNKKYGFECFNINNYTIDKYIINKSSYTKPNKTIINYNHPRKFKNIEINPFENIHQFLKNKGYNIKEELSVIEELQEDGSDITVFKCDIKEKTKVIILCIDHAMTQKSLFSNIILNDTIEETGNIYKSNANYDSNTIIYMFNDITDKNIIEKLYIDPYTKLAPYGKHTQHMRVFSLY